MRHLECQGLGGADIRAHFTFDFEEINILWVNHVERFSQNHKHKLKDITTVVKVNATN